MGLIVHARHILHSGISFKLSKMLGISLSTMLLKSAIIPYWIKKEIRDSCMESPKIGCKNIGYTLLIPLPIYILLFMQFCLYRLHIP